MTSTQGLQTPTNISTENFHINKTVNYCTLLYVLHIIPFFAILSFEVPEPFSCPVELILQLSHLL